MRETEWAVECAAGHRFYERIFEVPPDQVQWAPCPKCGAPRRGQLLPDVVVAREGDDDD